MSSTTKSVNRVLSSVVNDEIIHRRLPRPVCWHEGMLLSPQHFQQNHQYWEGQLGRIIASLSPNYWGVSELALDHADLLEGEINIIRLVAILPDGFIVDYDANFDQPLRLTLAEVGSKPMTAQLTIPIMVPGSASERSEIQRYTSKDDRPRIDENTGDNEIVMPRLEAKLSLQLADKVSNRYVGIPLFRVVKPEGGSFQIDPDYCPPLLSIAADQFRAGTEDIPGPKPIQQRAQGLALAIRHKTMQLAGVNEDGERLGSHINQRHHRWIRAMAQGLPGFEVIADSPDSSPQHLYESLVRMSGPISELAPNSIPPKFPAYCHDDNLPALNKVMQYIHTQIDRVNLNYTTLSFEQEREGVFTLMMEKSWEDKDLIVEVKPEGSDSRDGVARWMKSSRIASINLHKDLSTRRLLGAKAELIEREEKSGIVPASGNALFRIKADKRFITMDAKLVIVATSNKLKGNTPQALLVHIPHD